MIDETKQIFMELLVQKCELSIFPSGPKLMLWTDDYKDPRHVGVEELSDLADQLKKHCEGISVQGSPIGDEDE